MKAALIYTNIPGLFDLRHEDGREWFDLTIGQLVQVVSDLGLQPGELGTIDRLD